MHDPAHFRLKVAQLRALAAKLRDTQPVYADMLIERAEELQWQATALEKAAKLLSGPQPLHAAPLPAAQLSDQARSEN